MKRFYDQIGKGVKYIVPIAIPPGQELLRVSVNLNLGDAIGGCGGPHLPEASTVLVA